MSEKTWFRRNSGKKTGSIFQSDGGNQYSSGTFSELLKEHCITPSMSQERERRDNACWERLFRSLKME